MFLILILAAILYFLFTIFSSFEPTNDQIDSIQQMFPTITRQTIIDDLKQTKSVQETCERILLGLVQERGIVQGTESTQGTIQESNQETSRSGYSFTNNITITEKPTQEWKSTSTEREINLKQRKLFLLQQAKKYSFCFM
jgi:hypothetical protein